MKKTAIVVIVVLAVLAIGVFASKPNTTSDTKGDIRIGSILILSGEGASWGEASKNGIDLAVKEINEKGGIDGRKITVTHEDNPGSEPKGALTAFQKLVNGEGINMIIGTNWSNAGLPLVEPSTLNKTIMMSPSLGVREFNESSKYLFNTWPHDDLLSSDLADYVYGKGYRNVAVFGAKQIWNITQTNAFIKRFTELGGKIALKYEAEINQKDERSEILKVKANKDIDAVILTNTGYSLVDVTAQQLREFGVKLPLFAITVDQQLITNCNGACDGMTFLTFLTPSAEFEKKYKAAYNGLEVEIGADTSYDAVMMLADAIRATKSTDSDKLAEYLNNVTEYHGASGDLKSDGKRGFTKPYVIRKVIDGKQTTITE